MNRRKRQYDVLAKELAAGTRPSTPTERMRVVADSVWESLHTMGVSWVGFYLDQPHQRDEVRLVLGPCRDKPACSPIGLHGVCGQALTSRRVQIVNDVRDLGANYIACDPRDRSELVVPLIDGAGRCWAVLDVDSWEPKAFDADDAVGMEQVLRAGGLITSPRSFGRARDSRCC